jgi:phosphopantetheinyl transferase
MSASGGPVDMIVWRTCPIREGPEPGDEAWLTGAERLRAAAIGHHDARTRFVVGRALLRRTILELRPELAGSALSLTRSSSGRPHLRDHPELAISISHTRGLAAIAVAGAGRVGIDVEPRSRVGLPPVGGWLTPGEQRRMRALAPDRTRAWLLDRWVAKEAAIKAAGPGHPLGRRELEVHGDTDGDGRATVSGVTHGRYVHTDVRIESVPGGFVVAIATPIVTRVASVSGRRRPGSGHGAHSVVRRSRAPGP